MIKYLVFLKNGREKAHINMKIGYQHSYLNGFTQYYATPDEKNAKR